MEILQALQLKKELELTLCNLLKKYETVTGLCIEGVHFVKTNGRGTFVSVEVTVELK